MHTLIMHQFVPGYICSWVNLRIMIDKTICNSWLPFIAWPVRLYFKKRRDTILLPIITVYMLGIWIYSLSKRELDLVDEF